MRTSSARSLLEDLIASSTSASQRPLLQRFVEELTRDELEQLLYDWLIWAREEQLPPLTPPGTGAWTTWVFLGGRGAGKTRAGAEWVRGVALGAPPFAARPAPRIALIAETLDQARMVMVEGVSGVLSVHPRRERPQFSFARRELRWPNGAMAQIFSADDPESLRGPQFAAAWCDELAKWRYAEAAWDMLQFALRLGEAPRQLVTTTPRPSPLLKRLLADPRTVLTHARTEANAANLAPTFLSAIVGRYQGSRLGRQELDGEIIEDRSDALWSRDAIEGARVDTAPALERIVVAVDPPVSSGASSDACGIVGAGLAADGIGYVLADATMERAHPMAWASAVVRLHHRLAADCVVAEVNQGGELVAEMLRQIEPNLPVRTVRAMRGKYLRAEPAAALYEQGRVRHVGVFPELEDQMCDFGPQGLSCGRSPDRLDALVWAITELMLAPRGKPRVRSLS